MKPALLQIQTDVTARLSIELYSWGITVRSQRKMLVENAVDESQIVTTSTNGKTGCGCMVSMPTFETSSTDAPGPQGAVSMSIFVSEFPEANMNASTGTLRSAEEVAVRVTQLMHLFRVQNIGTFYCTQATIQPTQPPADGCVSYEVKARMIAGQDQLARTGNPTISGTSAAITITNASSYSTATIYYSIDGETFPGPSIENSYEYTAPFAVDVGTAVRAVAYLSGYTGSDLIESIILT